MFPFRLADRGGFHAMFGTRQPEARQKERGREGWVHKMDMSRHSCAMRWPYI